MREAKHCRLVTGVVLAAMSVPAVATETENLGLRVLPAPAVVTVDGKHDEWDLAGGAFICENVERLRDRCALWFHAMYDAERIYLLARWIDPTPMDNPGSVKGSYGFQGDCLQVRFLFDYEQPSERVSHWTCWIDREAQDVVDVAYGRNFREAPLRDAATKGARQAFRREGQAKGYAQELAIPWELIAPAGRAPRPGEDFRFTVEANFTKDAGGRITMKGIFLPGVAIDRIFSFRAYKQFGIATLERRGQVQPRPLRLSDAREFPVALRDGLPSVDWAGLIKTDLWPGHKPIRFAMPFDGFVSLNLYDAGGRVVRQLLTAAFFTQGEHEVPWDGLTSPYVKQPSEPVPAGEYTWRAIAHPGIGLRLRGWAHHGGSHPWNAGPGTGWGGNHGVPVSCAADDKKVYLGWSGAEGPAPLVACDLAGKVQWRSGTGGKDQALRLAADGKSVYAAFHGGAALFRVDAAKGLYTSWAGRDDTGLTIADIWPKGEPAPSVLDDLAAADGKLYLAFASYRLSESDVADWRSLLAKLASGEGILAGAWQRLSQPIRGEIQAALKGRTGFETVNQRAVVGQLNRLLDGRDLVPEAGDLGPLELQAASFKVLQAELGAALRAPRTNLIAALDGRTGKPLKTWPVPGPIALAARGDGSLLVVSKGTAVLSLDPRTGQTRALVEGLTDARDVAVDKAGSLYVLVGGRDCRVKVFSADGRALRAIGRKGGRPIVGPWVAEGMRNATSLVVDAEGRVWVTESCHVPKRVVVWDGRSGELLREFFGPTHYGASGGAISPRDPNLMVGSACEWRLDPKTGRATCLGVFDDSLHSYACFREAANGRLYLFVARTSSGGHLNDRDVLIFERLGDGRYARRAEFRNVRLPEPADGKGRGVRFETSFWADENGDQQRQMDEETSLRTYLGACGSNGWSLNCGMDLTLYFVDRGAPRGEPGGLKRIRVAGFTDCGAPKYDVGHIADAPAAWSAGGVVSANPSFDGRMVLVNQSVAKDTREWRCYGAKRGELLWSYPNPFYQVHGSHRAPTPQPGLFRGAYNPIGVARLPEPAGNVWIINGNLGEWHVLSEDGFYLTRLFSGDPFSWDWPDEAVPGAVLDDCPPGSGGEDFGGSATQGNDGRLYVQAGKSAFWNVEVVGLDGVVALPGGSLRIGEDDLAQAATWRARALQAAVGTRRMTVRRLTPEFTGDLKRDFPNCTPATYARQAGAGVTTVAAWDDRSLYVGWRVEDATPWVNGAKDPALLYARGDTVDFQLGSDPGAPRDRREAARGDLRISIGNFQGKPTAMLYHRIRDEKRPRTFSSGVVAEYRMDYVAPLAEAKVAVTSPPRARWYVVEAAVPLSVLGLSPRPGLTVPGDFGATHGDPAGQDTALRTHWSNQVTGLVDDLVFELKMVPRNWGELVFQE